MTGFVRRCAKTDALYVAAHSGHLAALTELLAAGCSIDSDDSSGNSPLLVRFDERRGLCTGNSAILAAIQRGHVATAAWMAQMGDTCSAVTTATVAVKWVATVSDNSIFHSLPHSATTPLQLSHCDLHTVECEVIRCCYPPLQSGWHNRL